MKYGIRLSALALALLVLAGCTHGSKTVLNLNSANDEQRLEQAQQQVRSIEEELQRLNQAMENEERVQVTLVTNQGDIVIELFNDKAPQTVQNFITLAQQDFYDGVLFHRVIPDFMIQTGDPLTKEQPKNWAIHGTGGPDYTFADEINDELLVRGSVAMANRGPNTNGSQFFIVTAPATPWLDGMHTNFGRVVQGMEVVDAIEQAERDQRDHPLQDMVITDIIIQK